MQSILAALTFVIALLFATAPAALADAASDLEAVYENTEAFDGGPGSTINTSPATADEEAAEEADEESEEEDSETEEEDSQEEE